MLFVSAEITPLSKFTPTLKKSKTVISRSKISGELDRTWTERDTDVK